MKEGPLSGPPFACDQPAAAEVRKADLLQKEKHLCEVLLFLERITGVEPAYAAWEAAVLPMNYIRVFRCEVYYNTDFPRLQREK